MKQYSFVFTFTNIFLSRRQEQSSLFIHCLSTQKRPHVRPRTMPRSVFSFTNNNPFYHKQSYYQNNQSYCKTINPTAKQSILQPTYCLGDRSAHYTLLRTNIGLSPTISFLNEDDSSAYFEISGELSSGLSFTVGFFMT